MKNIAKDKIELKKININFDNFPSWFKKETNYFSDNEEKSIFNTIFTMNQIFILYLKMKINWRILKKN